MIPNTNIDQLIKNNRKSLIAELSLQTKLPITDIKKVDFDYNFNSGTFEIGVYYTKTFNLAFEFKDNKFNYELSKIDNDLDNIWFKIFCENQQMFFEKICNLFITEREEIERVTSGKRPILYIYKKGVFIAPNLVECYFENNFWKLIAI